MRILLTNIKQLLQVRPDHIEKLSGAEMKQLPMLEGAYLLIENDLIADYGLMSDLENIAADQTIDVSGQVVLPAWCDSHTHIVYAGSREQEFVDRINGLSYEQIANRGGGILNSAKTLANTTEEDLYEQSKVRLEEIIQLGTGAVEIKSGYGLDTENELKMLRVIKRLQQTYPIEIKPTLLAAHAFPAEYKTRQDDYIDYLVEEMIPAAAKQQIAEYIDVFCETGYFSVAQTERILKAGMDNGLIPKLHVNQFSAIGGVQAGIKYNALSVDHLELMREQDIEALIGTDVMPVALPSCSYFLSIPYTPARSMLDAGLPIALATDYNPGSTPSGNMNFVVATACIKMKLTPEEAINAATINAAYAMGLSNTHGSITIGKKANLIITKPMSSFYQIPYAFGSNPIDKVMVAGKLM